jgi:hypothetical protein
MLRICTKPPVYNGILAYFEHYLEEDIKLDELSPNDWNTLRKIHAFLEEIRETTKALESDTSTLGKVLPAMDFILERFEQSKDEYKDDPIMAPMFNSGWAKMEKYYALTDESPAYIAALVLRPSYKWNYITTQWKAEWVTKARQAMLDLWTREYKPKDSTIPTSSCSSTSTNKFTIWARKHEVSTTFDDEYARYCASDIIPVSDSLAWWLEATQQQTYPNLSQMAIDFLSIPAMSAAPERCFSSTKETITDKRNKLGSEVIQAFECLKSWYKLKEFKANSFLEDILEAQLQALDDSEGRENRD